MASYTLRRKTFNAFWNKVGNAGLSAGYSVGRGIRNTAIGAGVLGAGAVAYGIKKAGDVVDAGTSTIKTATTNLTQGVGDAMNNMTQPTPRYPQQSMHSDHSYYRQRLFDEGQDGGGNTLLKGALGVGGSALAFYGARKGLFGNALHRGSNKVWGKMGVWTQKAGDKIGFDGMKSVGEKMSNSAANEYGMASALKKGLVKEGEVFGAKGTEVNLNNKHIVNEANEFKKNLYNGHDTFNAMKAAAK